MRLVENDVVMRPETVKQGVPAGVLKRIKIPICNIGERNRNGRVYDSKVWENVKQDRDVQDKLKNRSLYGDCEHPTESALKFDKDKTSHVIVDFLTESGRVYQIIDLLPTEAGKFINVLLEAGCGVGMSTRADGELEEAQDAHGTYQRVIPEKYRYLTTDWTADPSTIGGYPTEIQDNVVKQVRAGIESHSMSEGMARVLLESVKVDAVETKKLLESGMEKTIEAAAPEKTVTENNVETVQPAIAAVVEDVTISTAPGDKVEVKAEGDVTVNKVTEPAPAQEIAPIVAPALPEAPAATSELETAEEPEQTEEVETLESLQKENLSLRTTNAILLAERNKAVELMESDSTLTQAQKQYFQDITGLTQRYEALRSKLTEANDKVAELITEKTKLQAVIKESQSAVEKLTQAHTAEITKLKEQTQQALVTSYAKAKLESTGLQRRLSAQRTSEILAATDEATVDRLLSESRSQLRESVLLNSSFNSNHLNAQVKQLEEAVQADPVMRSVKTAMGGMV